MTRNCRSLAALAAAATALLAVPRDAAAQINVMLSLNVFPTVSANPNGGGAWALVAKTNSQFGIGGVNAYISGINSHPATLAYNPHIGASTNMGNVFVIGGDPVNVVYYQNIALPKTVVVSVGTPSFSPGPDPLGDSAWDDATSIVTGVYPGAVPFFAPKGGNVTDANTLSSFGPNFNFAIDANTTFIVRVAIPEPSAAVLAGCSAVAIVRRRRASVGKLRTRNA